MKIRLALITIESLLSLTHGFNIFHHHNHHSVEEPSIISQKSIDIPVIIESQNVLSQMALDPYAADFSSISSNLTKRQESSCNLPNYSICTDGNLYCCPIGGNCCGDGRCCGAGQKCCPNGGCAPLNGTCCSGDNGQHLFCESGTACCGKGCASPGGVCCSDGTACSPGSHCWSSSLGLDFCCSSGRFGCADGSGCCPSGTECYRDGSGAPRCRTPSDQSGFSTHIFGGSVSNTQLESLTSSAASSVSSQIDGIGFGITTSTSSSSESQSQTSTTPLNTPSSTTLTSASSTSASFSITFDINTPSIQTVLSSSIQTSSASTQDQNVNNQPTTSTSIALSSSGNQNKVSMIIAFGSTLLFSAHCLL